MGRKKAGGIIVLRTPYGRYEWWHPLDVIQYIPSGKRSGPDVAWLRRNHNGMADAIKAACKAEIERIKEQECSTTVTATSASQPDITQPRGVGKPS